MEEKVVPVIITTMEALDNALSGDFPLLYLDAFLYDANRRACDGKLERYACRFVQRGRAGTFFQRKQSEAEADIFPEQIYDPLCIL